MSDSTADAVMRTIGNLGVHEAAYVAGATDALNMMHDRMGFVRDQVCEKVAAAEAVEAEEQQGANEVIAAERQTALDAALQDKGRLDRVVAHLAAALAVQVGSDDYSWRRWAERLEAGEPQVERPVIGNPFVSTTAEEGAGEGDDNDAMEGERT